jgi:hypothetical protein
MNHSEIVSSLWGVDDLIRDTFKRGKYQDVILPLISHGLRRVRFIHTSNASMSGKSESPFPLYRSK